MSFLHSQKECPSCGSQHKGKPYCIYNNGAYCFSCGYTKNSDRGFTIQKQELKIPELEGCVFNPSQFSVENMLWLNKYYITPEQIKKYKIAQAPDGALIFSTIKNGNVVHYQKRYVTDGRVILSYGPKIPSISSINAHSVVLVEDYISHIRVGEKFDSVCLWGIKATNEFLKGLLTYSKILVWLDNDTEKQTNSGQLAAKKICKTLEYLINLQNKRFAFSNNCNTKIVNVTTKKDPKCYSPSEIENILGEENENLCES